MKYRLPIQSDLNPPPVPSESDELIDQYLQLSNTNELFQNLMIEPNDNVDFMVFRCMERIARGRLFMFENVQYGLFRFNRMIVINVDGVPLVLVTYHTDPGRYYLFTNLANYSVYQGNATLVKQICDEIGLLQNGFPLTVTQLSTILTRFTTYGVKLTRGELLIATLRVSYYRDLSRFRDEQGRNLPSKDNPGLSYEQQIL